MERQRRIGCDLLKQKGNNVADFNTVTSSQVSKEEKIEARDLITFMYHKACSQTPRRFTENIEYIN